MSDPIVVGADGSVPSERAVAWAADEAARYGRDLTIVHAVEKWPFDIPLDTAPGEARSLTREGRQVLADAERIARARQPQLTVSGELTSVRTVRALAGRSEKAFELVVGNRGLGGFTGLVLGSVGLGAVRHTACPVVVVRGEPNGERGEIAVGVGLGDDSAVLEYAFQAAAARATKLRVVHAWPFPKALDEPGAGADIRRIEERARWRVIEAHAPMRKRFPSVQVVEDIVQDNPAAALVAASRDTDLVIAGSHPREGLTVPRARAVTHALLHQAHCPVAVVPTLAAP
ncbi:universal stress protein [Actinomadura madurae]|uniref:universal stress protein n=1 Tax=Actinomadura madurae TaxID=1993 RepID=UPI002026AE52|nr:universal stress protein [Actinomadura madurae]MCP9948979.1 universal stress protein [Actinomadura madurae]MCP9965750.1 universal stress protein [Actinomadura madurae]MCP9978227.1 universal stress protein [Actinomadura madurae]MCQ0010259.1 universal stress protein [Actinomadura madurae]MCQ0014429.1 universal stress protein [Actinomadura madurae]